MMKKLEQLYEGKAKKVFATDDPNIVLVDYKDDATAAHSARSAAGSVNVIPPAMLMYTSLSNKRNPARFSSTASKSANLPWSTPLAMRRGLPNTVGATNA